jgi:transcriptional regulator with XRE-family HTH domain
MLTGFQIRAARAGLRITAKELAERARVSLPTIQRFETVDGVPPSRSSTLLDVKAALETAGIEFIGTPDDSPGIRLRSLNNIRSSNASDRRPVPDAQGLNH